MLKNLFFDAAGAQGEGVAKAPRNKVRYGLPEVSRIFIYCVFCTTQRCDRIAELLEICGVDRAFSPKIIRRQRRQGKNENLSFDLLPGYVFLYNKKEILGLSEYRWIDGMIREVGRPDDRYELVGPDREFAEQLYAKHGVVGAMTLIQSGETVTLSDSLFNGSHGVVTKVDYRKQRVRVDFIFNDTPCHTWVAIDEVQKL